MLSIKWIIVIIGVLVVGIPLAVLSAFNRQLVEINYIVGTISLPLPVVVITAFALGMLIILAFFGLTGLVWKMRAKSLEKQIDKIHKDSQAKKIEADFLASQK